MNQRDLPEIVSELIIELHELRSHVNATNGRIDRLERTVEQGFRELRAEIRQSAETSVAGFVQALNPFLNRLLDNDDQVKNHERRITDLENPGQA